MPPPTPATDQTVTAESRHATRGETTITEDVPPEPVSGGYQSIPLDSAWWAQITNSQRGWQPPAAERPEINPGLALNGATDLELEAFGVYSTGVVRISIQNGDLTDAFEADGGVRLTVGAQSWIFLLAGADMSVPYFWIPSNSDEVIEVYDLIASATVGTLEISDDPDTDFAADTPTDQAIVTAEGRHETRGEATVTEEAPAAVAPSFTDDTGDAQSWTAGTAITPVQVPAASGTPAPAYAVVGALPPGIGFNSGTLQITGTPGAVGTGTITIRAENSAGSDDWTVDFTTVAAVDPLVLADSDDTGLDVDAKALLVASAPGTAGSDPYVDSDRGGTDTPLDGELGLSATNTVISRFRRLVAAELTLNDNDSPAALDIGAYFNVGGDGNDLTIYLQTLDGEVSFTAAAQYVLGGGGFARFTLPADAQTLLDNLASGDRWIFKTARPATVTPTDQPITAEGRHDTRGKTTVSEEAPSSATDQPITAEGRHDTRGEAAVSEEAVTPATDQTITAEGRHATRSAATVEDVAPPTSGPLKDLRVSVGGRDYSDHIERGWRIIRRTGVRSEATFQIVALPGEIDLADERRGGHRDGHRRRRRRPCSADTWTSPSSTPTPAPWGSTPSTSKRSVSGPGWTTCCCLRPRASTSSRKRPRSIRSRR